MIKYLSFCGKNEFLRVKLVGIDTWIKSLALIRGRSKLKLPGYILGVGGWLRKKILPTDFRPLVETGWSSLILVPQSRGGGGWKKHFVGINFPNNCVQLVEIKAIKNDEKISTIFLSSF